MPFSSGRSYLLSVSISSFEVYRGQSCLWSGGLLAPSSIPLVSQGGLGAGTISCIQWYQAPLWSGTGLPEKQAVCPPLVQVASRVCWTALWYLGLTFHCSRMSSEVSFHKAQLIDGSGRKEEASPRKDQPFFAWMKSVGLREQKLIH